MSDNKKQSPPQHVLLVNGQDALPGQAKRIVNAPAPASNPDNLATKPLHSAVRPFSVLRKEIGR